VSGLRSAVAFLTPIGGAAAPTPNALRWFPLVGTGIGASLGLLWWATSKAWPPLVGAVIVVAADLLLTGLLHLDGLIDSADGLLPPLAPQRRLEVMADPHPGAFGVAAAVLVLVARVAALGSTPPREGARAVLLLAGLWCVSRSIMALATTRLPYLRATGGGLASAFLGGDPAGLTAASILGLVAGLAMLVAWHPAAAAGVVAGALAGAGAVLLLARRRLGGFTGDVLGAAGMVGETVGLIVAAARW
jgi:adenosylcobinamide-GDP ribazoletransferase